jgi:hypothetical protein
MQKPWARATTEPKWMQQKNEWKGCVMSGYVSVWLYFASLLSKLYHTYALRILQYLCDFWSKFWHCGCHCRQRDQGHLIVINRGIKMFGLLTVASIKWIHGGTLADPSTRAPGRGHAPPAHQKGKRRRLFGTALAVDGWSRVVDLQCNFPG